MKINSQVNNNSNYGGGGFLGALFLVFLTLKLTGIITWSWWWITAPLWGPIVLFLAIFIIALIFIRIADSR